MLSLDALEDLDTMTEIIGQAVLERRTELLDGKRQPKAAALAMRF